MPPGNSSAVQAPPRSGDPVSAKPSVRAPRVSVIVPTWNEETSLPALLESLEQQTVQDFEVLIADSASTDATARIAGAHGVRFLAGSRKGPAEGRNRGARAASADIFVFVDADCVMPRDVLGRILEALRNPAVIGGATMFAPLGGTTSERALFFLANAYQRMMIAWGFPHNAGFCFFFRRSAFEKLGGLREDLFLNETHDIALRSRSVGGFVSLPVSVATSMRRFRRHGFAQTVLHEYLGSTVLYYLARRLPQDGYRPEPVR